MGVSTALLVAFAISALISPTAAVPVATAAAVPVGTYLACGAAVLFGFFRLAHD